MSPGKSRFVISRSWLRLLPLLYLWVVLIQHLSITWSSYPQYAYGWAVPFLAGWLLWRERGYGPDPAVAGQGTEVEAQRSDKRRSAKISGKSEVGSQKSEVRSRDRGIRSPKVRGCALVVAFALLWCFARFANEAVPAWRGVSWAMAIAAIGITLSVLPMALRHQRPAAPPSDRFLFPVCFFLVAVPWPSPLESMAVRFLTVLTSSMAVEALGLFGIAAIRQGSLIELGSGIVGIDEACSGIRSLQAVIMLSLFFGAAMRLSFLRRAALVLGGLALSIIFNCLRASVLAWVAHSQGQAALGRWHDPAGVAVLLLCFLCLWLAARLLKPKPVRNPPTSPAPIDPPTAPSPGALQSGSAFSIWRSPATAAALLVWFTAVEIGVAAWFSPSAEPDNAHPAGTEWTLTFPADQAVQVSEPGASVQSLLHYDRGKQFSWHTDDGARWQAFFLEWLPGKSKAYLVQRHRPDKCMPMAGHRLEWVSDVRHWVIHDVPLAYRAYSFGTPAGGRIHVFYIYWEALADAPTLERRLESRFHVLSAIRAGARVNPGQKVLQVGVAGFDDLNRGEAELRRQLEQLVSRSHDDAFKATQGR